MPIRMVDDPQDQQDNGNDSGGGGGRSNFPGGGGGGGLIGLLPLLLGLFRGKGILLLLVIGVGGYFLLGRGGGGCNLGQIAQLATGGFLDPRQFEKANIYEPLAEDDTKNPLPESANLQKYAPAVGNQGEQGSCVAWSSAYGARTILESARSGESGNALRFSPAFLYNQIGLQGCQGSYIIRAMEFMTKQGSVAYDKFPYTDQDCTTPPSTQLIHEAGQFKMRGFNRLSQGDRTDVIDLRAIRENLAQGAPVVIGMMVGPSFMQPMQGQDLWEPEPGDQQQMGFGGHAMCVVGYDDKRYGGAFLIMNSWGPEWGNNGFAWVRYRDFRIYVREAYGLEPMARMGAAANQPFECEIGLVTVVEENKRMVPKGYVPLRLTGSNVFESTSPLQPGSRFKIEVKNTTECYIYVLGKETDGTSYTLFPYPSKDDPKKTKYSPFCGITGYRMFPKDKSMTPDSIGKRDVMAVVVSKEPLDWYALNEQISRNPQSDYATRLNNALGSKLVRNVRFDNTANGTMHFNAGGGDNQVVAAIVEITK
ncbi:C1 family peptidase [Paraflavitalea sp. CAU 1676]|uniref:C1 family peptidase n=1 Tax=Paraflavitalea sp. CAU 1676 TaxID=3032598 RepID=UPI0023DBB8BC|nr:C1 family peptidase [Paraflavitalea sp. CAU 1676]MDF2193695.1 C1 family peptidase [Paraflavitalea sp. CAU 1676]